MGNESSQPINYSTIPDHTRYNDQQLDHENVPDPLLEAAERKREEAERKREEAERKGEEAKQNTPAASTRGTGNTHTPYRGGSGGRRKKTKLKRKGKKKKTHKLRKKKYKKKEKTR